MNCIVCKAELQCECGQMPEVCPTCGGDPSGRLEPVGCEPPGDALPPIVAGHAGKHADAVLAEARQFGGCVLAGLLLFACAVARACV